MYPFLYMGYPRYLVYPCNPLSCRARICVLISFYWSTINMIFTRPISEIITDRFSCRQYLNKPIAAARRQELQDYISAIHRGPLGTPVRFSLAAASDGDRQALKGLGTYGTIKSPTGFILGAMGPGSKNLEDYGSNKLSYMPPGLAWAPAGWAAISPKAALPGKSR
jgi:hypothetical protein